MRGELGREDVCTLLCESGQEESAGRLGRGVNGVRGRAERRERVGTGGCGGPSYAPVDLAPATWIRFGSTLTTVRDPGRSAVWPQAKGILTSLKSKKTRLAHRRERRFHKITGLKFELIVGPDWAPKII